MRNSRLFPSLRRGNPLFCREIASSALVSIRSKYTGYSTIGLLAMTVLLASCSTLDILAAPAVMITQTASPPPSPTIVWFPPSATPTLQPVSTHAATPEMRPGLGDVTVTDDFSDPDLWDIAGSDEGSAAINNQALTLSVQPGVYMISLRRGLNLSSFYAELTARPSLCRGADSYGLLVRASAVAYYRFSVLCDRRASAERVSVGTREILQSPFDTGDTPPGAPGEVHIGVWAVGPEMRLFLNKRYQFTIINSNYASGSVGVFVHSAGDTAAVVGFSNLYIQEVNYSPPTKTPRP